MRQLSSLAAAALAAVLAGPTLGLAANHREAPITALDHKADITDVYAFVSYGENQAPATPPSKVTFIMGVDPLLEPANGPTCFPFDPEILYEIKVDNDHDAEPDVVFQFRFQTEQRLPGVFQSYVGIGPDGASAPFNSPPPVAPGTLIVPPRIDQFSDPGLGLRQTYTVTLIKDRQRIAIASPDGSPFFAVPNNVGPRTMDYAALYAAGTYHLGEGIAVFAGTTDDAFWIDLGGASTPSTCAPSAAASRRSSPTPRTRRTRTSPPTR